MARASKSEWAKRVQRWRDSGLTAREYAAETGLNASTLSNWGWKLGAKERAAAAGDDQNLAKRRRAGSTTVRSSQGSSSLRSSKPGESAAWVELTTTNVAAPLEVVLACGAQMRVPAGVDEETLSRVVRVLEAVR